jgi:hypothetical protein
MKNWQRKCGGAALVVPGHAREKSFGPGGNENYGRSRKWRGAAHGCRIGHVFEGVIVLRQGVLGARPCSWV